MISKVDELGLEIVAAPDGSSARRRAYR